MTYALGRGLEYYDQPAVRAIIRDAGNAEHHHSRFNPRHREEPAISDEENPRVMIITKKSLARRTFLRGVGTALALPLLDAMVPAMAGHSADRRQAGGPARLRLRAERDHSERLAPARRPAPASSSLPP